MFTQKEIKLFQFEYNYTILKRRSHQVLGRVERDGVDGARVSRVDGEALAGIDAPDSRRLVGGRRANQRVAQLRDVDVPHAVAVTLTKQIRV
jgi:hypothetical protein